MIAVTFVVDSAPPWKQIAADNAERARQAECRDSLQRKAREVFSGSAPLSANCAVTIHYSRSRGRSDSANIIGGILDSLQGIIFDNDNQVTEITYIEWPGSQDWYQVTITELPGNRA